MTALTSGRNTQRAEGDFRQGSVAAAAVIYAGAMIMRNAAGYLVPGQTALNLIGVGRAEADVDNSAGADGDLTVNFRRGVFLFENSSGADLISDANIGAVCYAVDDQTVALTDGTGTRSKAGTIDSVDALGVWVRFDEALTKVAV